MVLETRADATPASTGSSGGGGGGAGGVMDVTEERTKAIFERTTRSITEQGGTILKDVAWGRRRMAYELATCRLPDGVMGVPAVFPRPGTACIDLIIYIF